MQQTTEKLPVSMTDSAAKRIATILSGEPDGTFLRISVEGGGCSGFSYKFDLDTEIQETDLILESSGTDGSDAIVRIDDMSLPFIEGSSLDFVDDVMGQSFQVKNPNATASCGCGTSFSI